MRVCMVRVNAHPSGTQAAGTHGGGLTAQGGLPFGTWPSRFMEWFTDLGFLGPKGSPTRAATDVAAFAAAAVEGEAEKTK